MLVRVLIRVTSAYDDSDSDDDEEIRMLRRQRREEEEEDGEIVSSVRIFRRTLSAGRHTKDVGYIEAGGIGEVCTSPNHQRRGLSKILLKDAINIMNASSNAEGGGGMLYSFLHASADFRQFYTKLGGYQCVTSEWSCVPIKLQHLTSDKISDDRINNDWSIRQSDFPQDAVRLQQLHADYSEGRLITIVRSVQYWKECVSGELGDGLGCWCGQGVRSKMMEEGVRVT